MIKTKDLKTLSDFENLKKCDIVAVEWKRDSYKGNKRTRFASYEIAGILKRQTEIVLQKQMNVYFNYSMVLDSNEVSNVKSITLIYSDT